MARGALWGGDMAELTNRAQVGRSGVQARAGITRCPKYPYPRWQCRGSEAASAVVRHAANAARGADSCYGRSLFEVSRCTICR